MQWMEVKLVDNMQQDSLRIPLSYLQLEVRPSAG